MCGVVYFARACAKLFNFLSVECRKLSGVIFSFFSFSSDFLSNLKAFYVKRQGLVADALAWYITRV